RAMSRSWMERRSRFIRVPPPRDARSAGSLSGGLRRKAYTRARVRSLPSASAHRKEDTMVKVALFVRLEAKAGKEEEVAAFLKSGLPIVEEEPATLAWFGLQLGPSTFGIFDAFPDEAGRQAHLSGRVAAALMAKASDLLSQPPSIEKVDVLAAKLPG